MITIAKASDTDREVLFGNAAERAGISNPAIVEKDFWVCFMLDYLFHKSPWPRSFIFKGGTSLSKAYHAGPTHDQKLANLSIIVTFL